MIQIASNHLSSKEKSLVRKYSRFCLDKLVRRGLQRKSRIFIKIADQTEIKKKEDLLDFKQYKAWCVYKGTDENGYKIFEIVLNNKRMNKRAKTSIIQMKNLLIDLGHEIVHVSQYLKGELFDYANGDVRYRGVVYDSSHYEDEEKYYFSPWEIQSYGLEFGLYTMFVSKLKEECSQK